AALRQRGGRRDVQDLRRLQRGPYSQGGSGRPVRGVARAIPRHRVTERRSGERRRRSDMAKDPVLPVDDEARALAKKLMRTARSGALATNDAESGTPFASLVQVGTDLDGSPVILT